MANEHKVKLGADTKSHRAEFLKSIGVNEQFALSLQKLSDRTKVWAAHTRAQANIAGKAIAGFAVAAGGAYAAIYAKQSAFIDQQAKTADRLGLSTQALTGLQHAAEQTGASTEQLNMGLQRMTRRIGQVAATGSGEAKVALDQLGISIDDLKNKSPDQQFAMIAEKMKDVHDQGQKVFLTQKLFDSEGVKLLNTLNLGADGLNAMMTEAEQLGMTFDRIDAAKVEMANDEFDKAQKTLSGFGNKLATETAPLVGALSEMWTDNAKEVGGFGNLAQQVVQKVGAGLGFLADMGRGLQVTFLLVRQGVAEISNGIIQLYNTIAQAPGKLLNLMGFDNDGIVQLQTFADSMDQTTAQLAKELQELLMAPMPSEKVKAWIADVQTKFQAAAKEQAKSGNKASLEHLLIDDRSSPQDKNSQRLVESAQRKYQQIFDEQLKLEGKEIELENRRYERQKEQMEKEIELLRDKKLATAEIESEYRLAQEQAEAQHNANLEQIEKNKNQLLMDGYSELLGAMGSYFQGMEGKQAGYARAAISIGQTLLDEEKQTKIASIWANTGEAAMKAYNAMVGIPIVGPALAMGAKIATYGVGGLIAAKVSGIASFDGGGYTGNVPRYGGVDGKGGFYAILHGNESVIDHTKGQLPGMGGDQNVAVSYHFHGDPKENEKLLNNNRNATIRDARRLKDELGRPY